MIASPNSSPVPIFTDIEPGPQTPLRPFTRRTMDIGSLLPKDDVVNCLAALLDLTLFIIGTENGTLYFYSIRDNKFLGTRQTDKWISSMHLSEHCLFISGFNKTIEVFNPRAMIRIASLQAEKQQQAYSQHAIQFFPVDKHGHFIVNVGYLKFKIFSEKSLKVLKTFSIPEYVFVPSEKTGTSCVVSAFGVLRDASTMGVILLNDPHIYIFNYKRRVLIKTVKLYEKEVLSSNLFIKKTIVLGCENYFFVILQFGKNTSRGMHKVKTILYIMQVPGVSGKSMPSPVFTLELKDVGETLISQDVHLPQRPWISSEWGFFLVLGTAKGMSHALIICPIQQKIITWFKYRKSEHEEISSTIILEDVVTISSTASGHIILIENKPSISVKKQKIEE